MLIGYMITAATIAAFAFLVVFGAIELTGREKGKHPPYLTRNSLICLAAILVFFTLFALLLVHPVEQLYFDENIYQGIALNILHSGNALWCQYGTGNLNTCYISELYHDMVGYDVFLAAAFAVFGSAVQVAYGLQLLVGILSITCVFLLAGELSRKGSVAVASTFIFALIPQLFIWSRTQAVPDLPFMMFTVFAAFLFLLFLRKPDTNRLALFLSAVVLAAYTRTEGLLLLPLFAFFYFVYAEEKARKTISKRVKLLKSGIDNPRAMVIGLAFVLMILPLFYYSVLEINTGSYGQSGSQSLFSFSNLNQNLPPNTQFIVGLLSNYPTVSTYNLLPLAVLGVLALLLYQRSSSRRSALALAGALFLAYFLFYGFFYAGSAEYGVDVRFMLQVLPFLAILGGFGIGAAGEILGNLLGRVRKRHAKVIKGAVYAVLLAALVAVPFAFYTPSITLSPNAMPQASYPNNATAFFYANYSTVPANCLVFTFTPDLWYQYNRSAAQIGYLTGANQSLRQSFSSYSCFVIDYGYWCTVPPYENTLCSTLTSQYKLSTIASESNGRSSQFAFYKILNYSP